MIRDRRVWHPAFLPDAGLPERFLTAEPSGIGNPTVREVVERYIQNFWDAADRGIAPVFFGGAGRWKTYGAAVLVRWAQYEMVPTQFVECGPWFQGADAAFYTPENAERLEALGSIPFVVLDDVTQLVGGTRPAELMANVVAARFAAGLPTVFTGNVQVLTDADWRTFGQRYRPDFVRRIWHGSDGYRATRI